MRFWLWSSVISINEKSLNIFWNDLFDEFNFETHKSIDTLKSNQANRLLYTQYIPYYFLQFYLDYYSFFFFLYRKIRLNRHTNDWTRRCRLLGRCLNEKPVISYTRANGHGQNWYKHARQLTNLWIWIGNELAN